MSRGTVGLGAPEIAGDQDDSVFGYRGGDEGVAEGATRDVERVGLAWSRSAPWALRNREPGKLCASSRARARRTR
jgi:hypothetical protein